MSLLSLIWNDIRRGRNFDIYIAVVIALTIAILGTIGIAGQTIISSALLATLAVLSTSLLINRHENEEVRSALLRIENNDKLADKFLLHEYDRSKLPQILGQSHKVFFLGISFTTHIVLLKDAIERGLQDGLQVRFLIAEPWSAAAAAVAFRKRHSTAEDVSRVLEQNLRTLGILAGHKYRGTLEYRVIDYSTPYTVVAFDPHLPTGRMFVRLTAFRVSNEMRPTFELTRKYDAKWIDFFLEQFESLWKESHEYIPKSLAAHHEGNRS